MISPPFCHLPVSLAISYDGVSGRIDYFPSTFYLRPFYPYPSHVSFLFFSFCYILFLF
jgi:hypothetical protein